MSAVTAPARFAAVAGRCPERIAVVADGDRLTYQELDARVNGFAHRLVAAGVARGSVVAVMVERDRAQFVVAALASWRAGAVYLPVDPTLPPARIGRMLDELAPSVIVGQDPGIAGGPPVLRVGAERAEVGPDVPVTGDDLAYVVHTSGSSGEPKPVAVGHAALENAYRGWEIHYGLGQTPTTCLQAAGPAFDVHVGDLVRALLSGGTLVLCPVSVLLDPPALAALLARESVDLVELTPSVSRLLVDWALARGRRLDSLRLFVSGGEQWTAVEYRRLRRVLPAGARVVNSYGVAEAGIDSTFHEVTQESLDGDLVPIGLPFPGVEVDVRAGELYLGGAGLAHGYLNRPQETDERFLNQDGKRWYRTGDLVRRGPGGVLTHLGRADDEVKVRGVRIRLGAVAAALLAEPEVAAAVAVCQDVDGQRVLVAHVTAGQAHSPTGLGRRLRSRLAATLPAAMVPARVHVEDRLPMMPSGKVDRGALTASVPRFVAATETEGAVAAVWERLLGRAPDDADENLFEAGGDSLTAARLAAGVRDATGTDVGMAAVLSAPTVARLSALVDAMGRTAPTTHHPVAGDGALAPNQHALWLHHQLDPADPTYHLPTVLRLTGPLDVAALRSALDQLVVRHDALRASVVSGPRLRIGPPVPFPFEECAADADLADLIGRPFDLTTAPLARAALVRSGPERHDLVLVVHHLVGDDWTERILLRELGQLYSGQELAPAPSYAEFTAAWNDRLAGPAGDAHRAYWRTTLANPPAPLDLPSVAAEPGPPGRARLRVPAAAVRSLASEQRVTPFVTVLTALSVLLSRWSGAAEVPIGVPLGHRDRRETDGLVGFLVSTLPLRLAVPAEATFAELLPVVARELATASAHAELPYDQVSDAAGPPFRVWFNWLGAPDDPPSLAGLTAELVAPPVPGALFDLAVYVSERAGTFVLDLVHDVAVFEETVMRALLDQLGLLLRQLCDHPDQPVRQHSLRPVAADDLADLRTEPPGLVDTLLAAATARPAHPAVAGPDGTVTYAELYARAGALAGELGAAGVRPGDVVPLYAERTPELVAAMLAVLGAGAAVAVLDHELPPARLAERVAASGARTGVLVHGAVPAELTAVCPQWIESVPGAGGAWPAARAATDGIAHVGYTSGTTGTPREVLAGSAPLRNFLAWYPSRFGLGRDDRFTMLSGLGHDPLFRDVFTPLWLGATLCVPPSEYLRGPAELRAWLAGEAVTVVHVTPALCRLLALADDAPPAPALRLVCSAGDRLTAADVAGIRAWAPHAVVANAYGATETPQVAAVHEVGPDPEPNVPVGSGAPGSRLLVLDDLGRPAGVGELGSIVVRGPYLATCAGHPGFVADPVPGHRRFVTGDLGRYRPDGTVTVAGRADDQVQLRGYRVELGELDRALRDHPRLRDAAVAVHPGQDGEPAVAAYVVGDGAVPTVAGLRAHLRRWLPEYALPVSVTRVAAIPLTGNGKVNRDALPTPAAELAAMVVAPASGMERLVAGVWCAVLGSSHVGVEQNFFDLGATSVLVVRAQQELQRRLARPIPVTALFAHPTVRALAGHLSGSAGLPARADRAPVVLADVRARRLAARAGANIEEARA
jgi:amino acid adenylation domain-containing protein